MNDFELNIANKEYIENKNGIMICGYEWGFSKEDQQAVRDGIYIQEEKSFFSDETVNDYPYRNRIVSWLRSLGLPLNSQNAGILEKSIVQTNWMDSQGYKVEGNIYIRLREQKQNFLNHLEYFKPKIVLFFGVRQLEVLNKEILKDVEHVLGKTTKKERYIQKDIEDCKKYRIGFQSFENSEIIAFPHPATQGGLCDSYIELYKDEIKPIFDNFIVQWT